jgi:hypothetical protein
VSEAYHHRTLVINFSNPVLPLALESVFGSDKRLLRLYESGLPSWAVFMPTYGAPIRVSPPCSAFSTAQYTH